MTKIEMDSYSESGSPAAEGIDHKGEPLSDDIENASHTPQVGQGLQRNLQARHLTMISL
ncbi:hypothetical protein BGZ88_006238, partial [Linnemannia elongata]